MPVLGKQTPEFDTSLFEENNPFVISKNKATREKSSTTMKTIDRTVLQRHVAFALTIDIFTFKRAKLYTFSCFLKTCESKFTYLLHMQKLFYISLSAH